MNEMQVFEHPAFGEVRTVVIDGEPWFVGKDVAERLGYSNTNDALIRHVDPEDKLQNDGVVILDPIGRKQHPIIINESGLYSLILSSKLPTAKAFKRWVTAEVLPAIRQRGSYTVQQPMTPAQLIAAQAQVLVQMEQRMDAIQSQQTALEQRVETAIKVFSRPSEDHWKDDTDKAIKELCQEKGMNLLAIRGQLYQELERRCGCNIDSRLRCLRQRMKKQGMRHRDAMELTKLDAVAADKKLRAAFEGVVREWQATAETADE